MCLLKKNPRLKTSMTTKLMKKFVVASYTNYGLMIHLVAALDERKAKKLALKKGAWPFCEVTEFPESDRAKVLKLIEPA